MPLRDAHKCELLFNMALSPACPRSTDVDCARLLAKASPSCLEGSTDPKLRLLPVYYSSNSASGALLVAALYSCRRSTRVGAGAVSALALKVVATPYRHDLARRLVWFWGVLDSQSKVSCARPSAACAHMHMYACGNRTLPAAATAVARMWCQ